MTVPVPESIRATAIEAAQGAINVARAHSGVSLTVGIIRYELANQIVDAVLPAVVAQVQADAFLEAAQIAENVQNDDEIDQRLGAAAIKIVLREKGENNHE